MKELRTCGTSRFKQTDSSLQWGIMIADKDQKIMVVIDVAMPSDRHTYTIV